MDLILPAQSAPRKIIHIDMDCFYAAIEIRDNPALANKPVAVGGTAEQRSVLCTANYIARKYGVRSAMPTSTALRLCKDLVLVPVNMPKYKAVASRIHQIFHEYTDLVEPLALDEAYLDVSQATHCKGSATLMAQEIRAKIFAMEQLTASAGVAANKFLAKIASGWKKPNGLFVIKPEDVAAFVPTLAVEDIFGVGKVTAQKLHQLGYKTCADLQKLSYHSLKEQFGRLGEHLYDQCRGIDNRPVIANRERKSLSVEHTFPEDMNRRDMFLSALTMLHQKLVTRVRENASDQTIKNQYIKIKFNNFRQITAESVTEAIDLAKLQTMFLDTYAKVQLPVRLIGVGVHFAQKEQPAQQSLF